MSQVSTSPITVTSADLPLTCPMDNTPAWCHHPKIFLDVVSTGQTKCPYCGTEYIFHKDVVVNSRHAT